VAVAFTILAAIGCASSPEQKKKEDFFTSGNPAADRRAEQTVPKAKDSDKPDTREEAQKKASEAALEKQTTLYERLGGTNGIQRIVDDFIKRALEDPRVNWTRTGVRTKGWFRTKEARQWEATPENIRRLKLHFVQFISLAAGGPTKYDGKPMQPAHLNMQITKAEFDATIGDLKATLDHLNIANDVQKDLIAIFESTRQQIVVER
jgi:hemoglobin